MVKYSDEDLCRLAAAGNCVAEETLVARHARLVRICARPYFLAGGDSEDLIQEGMLGLLQAIREYAPEKETSFRTFAELCIRRRLFSAIRAAVRDKHQPLNTSVSLEPLFCNGNQETLSVSHHGNPEDMVIGREEAQELKYALSGQLSGFETKVLGLYLNGLSYFEIASELDRSTKSVDNAVQRVRRKLARKFFTGEHSNG